MKTYQTYKFYDSRGRRIGAIAYIDGGKLQIYMLRCTKRDRFSKRRLWEYFNEWVTTGKKLDSNPLHARIDVGDNPAVTLVRYMEEHYYRKITVYRQEISYRDFLVKDKKEMSKGIPYNNRKMFNPKMSMM